MNRRTMLLGAATALSAATCGQILGLGDFTDCPGAVVDGACEGQGGAASSTTSATTTSTTGAGGEGGSGLCPPGHQESCYTGPAATQHKGICRDGMKTCGNNGIYGPCMGQQLPAAAEVCGNGKDDDCDGMIDDGCPCTPGDMMACYDATDMSTENNPPCQGGMATCQPDGMSYGTCVGEVTPQAEDYSMTGDENCDGVPSADTQWVDAYSAVNAPSPHDPLHTVRTHAVTVDATGSTWATGEFAGTATFGGMPLTANRLDEGLNPYVLKLDAMGATTLAIQPTSPAVTQPLAIASGNGAVVVGGGAFGGGTVLQSFDASGNAGWTIGCTGGGNTLTVNSVSMTAQGEVFFGGVFEGMYTCGGMAMTSASASHTSLYVGKANATGAVQWIKPFSDSSGTHSETMGGVAASPDGDVWVTGQLTGTIYFVSGVGNMDTGNGDVFLIKLDGTSGSTLLRNSWGDMSAQAGVGVAVSAAMSGGDYRVAVTGYNEGNVDFGNGALPAVGTRGGFVATFDSQMIEQSSTYFGGAGAHDQGVALAYESSGDLMLAGSVNGAVAFGPSMAGSFSSDVAVYTMLARLDPSLALVWSKYYGGDKTGSSTSVEALALDPTTGYARIGGTFDAAANFGLGPVPGDQQNSGFVVSVAAP
ncbi:MAG TPA: hypothetical protein VGM56_32595 [Byssovorax sp.]|jgi:hypothetical protein